MSLMCCFQETLPAFHNQLLCVVQNRVRGAGHELSVDQVLSLTESSEGSDLLGTDADTITKVHDCALR